MRSIFRRSAVLAAAVFTLPLVLACQSSDAPRPASNPTILVGKAQTTSKATAAALRKAQAVKVCTVKHKGWATVPAAAMSACVKLGSQPQHVVRNADGSSYVTATGPKRVEECRTQYRGAELRFCLNQPLKG